MGIERRNGYWLWVGGPVPPGSAGITLGKLVTLGPGSLVTLDRESHEPADILVNGKVVARGEIVTLDKNYGVRITHVSG